MTELDAFSGALEPDGDYEALAFDDLDLSGQDGAHARFIDCVLRRCGLDGTGLDHAQLLDTSLREIHAGTLDLADATWRDVDVADCRLGAVQAYGGRLTRVTVRGGKIDYLNLREAHLTDVRFAGCVIGDLDLIGVHATRLVLEDSRIGRLDLTHAVLTDVDLRTADLSRLDGLAGLAGATISQEQLLELAPALAAHLRIIVA